MKFCTKCGAELHDEAVICPKCGCAVSPASNALDNSISDKNWVTTFLLCFFLGILGVHRFYVGRVGSGIAMILTMGGLGIWLFVDFIVIICGNFKDKYGKVIKNK
ncbi:MAG: NINE protein [Bacteroidales bacterium]|nr:NINE protein [Bacteroidales bacterium]